mgnify:CR=1 FL=1
MSKFFLKPPKAMFSSRDYRIISFLEVQSSLKKFKEFQIRKTIQLLKSKKSEELETHLAKLKKISTPQINNLTVYLLSKMQIELPKAETFLNKMISTSVQNVMDSVEMELAKGEELSSFLKKY